MGRGSLIVSGSRKEMYSRKQSEKLIESLHGNEKHGTLSEQQERKLLTLALDVRGQFVKG